MAINEDKLKWAINLETESGALDPNRTAVPEEVGLSGLKNNQPLPRQWYNELQYQQYLALVDLQDQITSIVLDGTRPTLEAIHPVGKVWMSYDPTTPDVVLGFGTWERVEGRFLVGISDTDSDFPSPNFQGGSKDHSHTDNFSVDDHVLTINQMPSHTHDVVVEDTRGAGILGAENGDSGVKTITSEPTGGSQGHNHGISGGIQSAENLPPYECLYIWKRTA